MCMCTCVVCVCESVRVNSPYYELFKVRLKVQLLALGKNESQLRMSKINNIDYIKK